MGGACEQVFSGRCGAQGVCLVPSVFELLGVAALPTGSRDADLGECFRLPFDCEGAEAWTLAGEIDRERKRDNGKRRSSLRCVSLHATDAIAHNVHVVQQGTARPEPILFRRVSNNVGSKR